MGNYWKCKNCGKINMDYVGTCACGGLKSDGEAATEEEYKNQVPEKDIPPNNKRKWKCPNCSRVNQGDFCSCGYVKSRFDKYIDEETPMTYDYKVQSASNGRNKGLIIGIAVIVSALLVVFALFSQEKKTETGTKSNKANSEYSYASAQCDDELIMSVVGNYCKYQNSNSYDTTSKYKYSVESKGDTITYTVGIEYNNSKSFAKVLTVSFSRVSGNDYKVTDGSKNWKIMLTLYKANRM